MPVLLHLLKTLNQTGMLFEVRLNSMSIYGNVLVLHEAYRVVQEGLHDVRVGVVVFPQRLHLDDLYGDSLEVLMDVDREM